MLAAYIDLVSMLLVSMLAPGSVYQGCGCVVLGINVIIIIVIYFNFIVNQVSVFNEVILVVSQLLSITPGFAFPGV